MPTEEQRANLDKLATYLESLPDDYKKFSMYSFFCGPISESEFDLETVAKRIKNGANPCGTVACAIGHGPAAGISVNDPEIHGWFSYAKVRFGALNHWVGSVDENSEGSRLWSWLFASEWHTTDNTVKGAAARIRWYLQHGIPDNSDLAMHRFVTDPRYCRRTNSLIHHYPSSLGWRRLLARRSSQLWCCMKTHPYLFLTTTRTVSFTPVVWRPAAWLRIGIRCRVICRRTARLQKRSALILLAACTRRRLPQRLPQPVLRHLSG